MAIDFTIVTAVTPEFYDMLKWSIGSWVYKPQFCNRPLIVYYNGMPEHKLHFIKRIYNDVRFIQWSMNNVESKSELMFSSFVFGAVRDVKTPYYMKLDADAYCFNKEDVWNDNDMQYDLIGHKWHYTKPGWFINQLDNIYNKTNNPVDKNLRHYMHRRIESYCCLHRTEWVKKVSDKFNGRLPVPSHDTSLWYYADKGGKWLAKNIKNLGVSNAQSWKAMREIVCSGDTAFNKHMNEVLLNHVQIEITSRCNIGCIQCDRNCGAIPAAADMEISQIWKFVEESLNTKKEWGRIDVIGGEPTLHKKLDKVLEIISIYHRAYPRTQIRFSTNGLGDKVNEALKLLPDWVKLRNSSKHGKDQPHKIYRNAPVDCNVKDVKACSVPWRCGLGLTPNGYFPCGAGAALARAFGFDIGIKSFSELSADAIKKQMIQLCKYCGHSNSIEQKEATDQYCSESWKRAIDNYKPELMSQY